MKKARAFRTPTKKLPKFFKFEDDEKDEEETRDYNRSSKFDSEATTKDTNLGAGICMS